MAPFFKSYAGQKGYIDLQRRAIANLQDSDVLEQIDPSEDVIWATVLSLKRTFYLPVDQVCLASTPSANLPYLSVVIRFLLRSRYRLCQVAEHMALMIGPSLPPNGRGPDYSRFRTNGRHS